MKVQCVGRRYLEITELDDGNYQVMIMLQRRRLIRLATLIIERKEFEKIYGFEHRNTGEK